MSLENQVIAGARWSALGIWGRRLCSFFIFAILARHLNPDSLGLVALALIYIGFVEMLSKQGLGMAIIQRKEINNQHLNTAFYINLFTAIIIALLSFLFSDTIAEIMGDPRLSAIIQALSISLPISATSVVPIALQSRSFDFKSQAVQTFSATITSGLVAIPMAFLGFEAWALVTQTLIFTVVGSFTVWVRTTWRPSFAFDWSEAKSLTSFSLKILLSNLVGFARGRVDQILIGVTTGPVGLGYFALGRKLNETIDSFVKAPIDRVAVSAFSRIQDDPPRLESAIRRAMSLNALFSVPTFLGLALLSQELIPLAFGPQWVAAAAVCAILALNRLTSSLFFFNYHVFISQGYPGLQTLLQTFQALGVAAATLIGQRWGIEGVARSILVSNLILSTVTTIVMGRKVNVPIWPIFKAMFLPLAAGAIMAAAVYGSRLGLEFLALHSFNLPSIATVAVLTATGALVYAISIRLLSPTLFSDALSMARKVAKRPARKKSTAIAPQPIP